MPQSFIPILVLLGLAAVVAGSIQVLRTRSLGPKLRTRRKLSTYESGVPLIDSSHKRISIKFFVIAMVFILFDVEIAFIYPWALVFRSVGLAALRRDARLPRGPRRRLRLHLEEGSVRLVSHTRYRIEAAGRAPPVPARGDGADRGDPRSATRRSRRRCCPSSGSRRRPGAGSRRSRAEEVARILEPAGVARRRRADVLHDVQPAPGRQEPAAGLHVDLLPPARAPRRSSSTAARSSASASRRRPRTASSR